MYLEHDGVRLDLNSFTRQRYRERDISRRSREIEGDLNEKVDMENIDF